MNAESGQGAKEKSRKVPNVPMYKANGFFYVESKFLENEELMNSLPLYKRKLLRPIRWHTTTYYEKGSDKPKTKVFKN